jgi:phytanoyl-CoA hydroxylase
VFSPTEIEELKLKFDTQGYVHLREVIPPAFLARLKQAFDRAAASQAGTAERGFVDLPAILDQDDAFIDLVDMQSTFDVLVALIGGDIQLTQTIARLFYPGPTFTAPFHSDLAHVVGFSHAHSLNFHVKVHYYIEDLSPDQGCLAFIPGSHRLPAGYQKPAGLLNEHSDAAVKIVPKAGDAVIFNTHVLHMALDNRSERVRKSIIYAYSHFWMKQFASAVPSDVARFSGSKQRLQLFGVEDKEVPYFNRTLASETVTPYQQVISTGKRLLKRISKMA